MSELQILIDTNRIDRVDVLVPLELLTPWYLPIYPLTVEY